MEVLIQLEWGNYVIIEYILLWTTNWVVMVWFYYCRLRVHL
jgi:hypothetical protein